MSRPAAILLIIFVLSIVIFGTWQLFLGHFEAAFLFFPFLLIVYFFVKSLQK
jgi:hypothetical protein